MAQLGIKNVSKKSFSGTYDGVIYEFKAGELKLMDPEVAVHLAGASNQAAIGAYALKIVPLADIPEELRKEPSTKIDSLMGVKSVGAKPYEVMYDGKIFKFPKGEVVFLHKEVAAELISRSMDNGKPMLVEAKAPIKAPPAPQAGAPSNKEENKKEGK